MDSELLLYILLLGVFAYSVGHVYLSLRRDHRSRNRLRRPAQMVDIQALLLELREDPLDRKESDVSKRDTPNSIGVGNDKHGRP